MPVDKDAQVLASLDAQGVNLADLDMVNPDRTLVPGHLLADSRSLTARLRRRRMIELFAKYWQAGEPDALKRAYTEVGWAERTYWSNRKKDPRFRASIDAIRGGSNGRPSKKKQTEAIKQRDKLLMTQRIEREWAPPPDEPVVVLPLPSPEMNEGWHGFAEFRRMYFGMETYWFQQLIISKLEAAKEGSVTLILIPPGHGKGLDLETPLPTPTGWTTMGAVQPGDLLLDETGEPCTVTYVSPVHHRPCYRVTFGDGASVVCDDEHLWFTRTRKPQHRSSVKTVGQIAGTVHTHGRPNHAVPVAEGLVLPPVDLPVDPYVLGVWLGDGHTNSTVLTSEDPPILDELNRRGCATRPRNVAAGNQYQLDTGEIAAAREKARRLIEDEGYSQTAAAKASGLSCGNVNLWAHREGWRLPSNPYHTGPRVDQVVAAPKAKTLQERLRDIGVLGHKHIPAAYLRASYDQRLDLLQGLMDTDGTCSKQGQCSFTTTRYELAVGVKELVHSLGIKVRMYESRARLNGRDCGPKWDLSMYPRDDVPVFKLHRKWARQVPVEARGDRHQWQQIIDVTPVESVPTRCIQVDSPNRMFLCGETFIPTHNTTLLEDWIGFKLAMEPDFRIIYASEGQKHTRKVIKRVKGRMHPQGPAQEYVRRFGPFMPQTGDDARPQTWAADEFDVWRRSEYDERDHNMVGLGFGSNVAGSRCDLLVVDDVQSLKSLNQTESIVEEFRQDWLSRPEHGYTVVLGTRVGENDFYERIIDEGIVDEIVKLPAIDPTTGRLLWPEQYDQAWYDDKRRKVGEAAWARNFMQRPTAAGERTFDDTMLAAASDPLLRVGIKPDHLPIRSAIVTHDPGFGINAVFVAGVTDSKFVALDWRTDRGLTSTAQMAQILDDTMQHWTSQGVRISHLVIEDKYVGQGLMQDDAFLDLCRKYGCSLSGHKTGNNKIDDDLGVAGMARSFRLDEIVLPGADDDETKRKRAALDAELCAWRPMVRGSKLRQDLVMAAWFGWHRWRTERLNASTDDRTNLIRTSGLGAVKPLPFRAVVNPLGKPLVGAR